MASTVHRLTSLDGLRGVAAFTVVLCHTAASFSGYHHPPRNPLSLAFWTNPFSLLEYTPLRAIINGPGAVDVFFVLSGLVLALSLEKVEAWSFGPYLIKRLTRIYLPFAFAICAAALLWHLLSPIPLAGAGVWLNHDWPSHQLTSAALAAHLGMYAADRWLDNPMWSLVYELRVSIFFPILAWWTRKAPRRMLVGWGLVAACCTALRLVTQNAVAIEIEATLGISYLFVLGAALYFNLDHVRAVVARTRPSVQILGWGLGLMLLIVVGQNIALAWCSTAGAALIVALAASDTAATRYLSSRVARWLGKVSYSLYLTHVIVIQVIAQLLGGRMWLVALVAIPAALMIAEVLVRVVERPSMRLGRSLASRLPRPAMELAPAR